MATAPPPAKGGFWQKKEAGLPIWAWVLIVGGSAAAFILYTRLKGPSSSSTGAAAASGSGSGSGAGLGGFGVGGYGGSGTTTSTQPAQILPSPGGSGLGGHYPQPISVPPQPTTSPVPSPSSPGNPSLPFQVQSGSGWWPGGSNWATDTPQQQQQATAAAQAAGPITDASGNEYEWLDSAEYNSIQGSGVQVYYEPLPGVFIPVPSNMANLAPGTPLYMQVPSGTAANASVPATAGA